MHAAAFISLLKIKHPGLRVTGIGGKHMQNAGAELISDLASFGVTGFSEVFKHFFVIKKAFRLIQEHLKTSKPDLLILVDYPGFNLRLAKYAKQSLGLRVLYYISPQIWAWKANRIHRIKASVDRMAVILPFEKKLYEEAGVAVNFVGHPLVNTLKPDAKPESLRKLLQLPQDKRLIALLPGSRNHEIERLLPVLLETAKNLSQKFSDLHFVIPIASTISIDKIKACISAFPVLPISCIEGQAVNVVACSDIVAVASGTASLECALLEKPMCIIYKTSLLTYVLACRFIRVKYLGLCNLMAKAMIVPEFLQDDCNPEALTLFLSSLLEDERLAKNMVNRLTVLKNKLSMDVADCTITDLIESELSVNTPVLS